ncbi:MAG: NUDIX domain-containing protein [Alphaproteobacteria bacterium]|nr:NUDIX domain-containing protein [Alphaproteobacteria bacterium]
MTVATPSFVAEKDVGIRTTSAILVTPDGRYLMQLRDHNPEITFPGFFCLFGGALEPGEELEAGLRRELNEELEMEVEAGDISYFSQFVFDAVYTDGGIRQCYYFEIPIDPGVVDTLVLHEGADMKLMTADDIKKESFRLVPYDLGVLHLHMILRQKEKDGRTPGTENGLWANGS